MDRKNKCIVLLAAALALALFFDVRFWLQARSRGEALSRVETEAVERMRTGIIETRNHLEFMLSGVTEALNGGGVRAPDDYLATARDQLDILENKVLRQIELSNFLDPQGEFKLGTNRLLITLRSTLHVITRWLDTTPPVQEYADIRPELLDFREFLRLTHDTYSGVAETLEADGGDSAETMLYTFHELTSEININAGYFSDLRNFFGKGDR